VAFLGFIRRVFIDSFAFEREGGTEDRMMKFIYLGILCFLIILLIRYIFTSKKKWEWLMAAFVLAPWILRLLQLK